MSTRPAAGHGQPERDPADPAPAGTHAHPGKGATGGPAGPPLSQSLRPRGPVQLEVSHYGRADCTVVAVAGELDILTAPKFSATIDELVRKRAGDVLVDLSEVRFVDSAGLQVLLSARRRMTRQGRGLAMICPDGPARRVMELARLTDALGVLGSFAEYDAQLPRPGSPS